MLFVTCLVAHPLREVTVKAVSEQERRPYAPKRRHLVVVMVLFATLCICAALGARLFTTAGGGAQTAQTRADAAVAAALRCGDASCAQRAFEVVARILPPEQALARLKDASRSSDNVASLCHVSAHSIGVAAFARFGDAQEAFRHGDPLCLMGYYHGVVTAWFAQQRPTRQTLDEATTLCDIFADQPGRRMNCVHGLAHGLYEATGGDFAQAMRACENYPEDLVGSCTWGVGMEWAYTLKGVPDDPRLILGLCDPVSSTLRDRCRSQAVRAMELFAQRLDRAALTEAWKAVLAQCEHGPRCIEGSGRKIAEQYGLADGVVLCQSALDGEDAHNCRYGVLWWAANLTREMAEWEQACSTALPAYADECAAARRYAEFRRGELEGDAFDAS